MARIYSSRTLLDPQMLEMLNRASESRLNRDIERRRNVLGATQTLLGDTGKTLDEYLQKKRTDEDYRKRYQDVAWQSSEEQMRDPMYRAALDEYARTGSASPVLNYQLAKATREATAEEKAKREAEAAESAKRVFEQEKAAAYPSYLDAISKSIDANAKGNKREAKIYSEQASALQKKYNFTDAALTDMFSAAEEEREAKEQEAEELAMGERNLKAMQDLAARESREKRYEIESKFPAKIKDVTQRQELLRLVDEAKETLVDEDYNYLKDKIFSGETTEEKKAGAVQSAVAGAAGKKAEKQLADADELKKIRDKQAKGIPLSSRERKILNEAGGK